MITMKLTSNDFDSVKRGKTRVVVGLDDGECKKLRSGQEVRFKSASTSGEDFIDVRIIGITFETHYKGVIEPIHPLVIGEESLSSWIDDWKKKKYTMFFEPLETVEELLKKLPPNIDNATAHLFLTIEVDEFKAYYEYEFDNDKKFISYGSTAVEALQNLYNNLKDNGLL